MKTKVTCYWCGKDIKGKPYIESETFVTYCSKECLASDNTGDEPYKGEEK